MITDWWSYSSLSSLPPLPRNLSISLCVVFHEYSSLFLSICFAWNLLSFLFSFLLFLPSLLFVSVLFSSPPFSSLLSSSIFLFLFLWHSSSFISWSLWKYVASQPSKCRWRRPFIYLIPVCWRAFPRSGSARASNPYAETKEEERRITNPLLYSFPATFPYLKLVSLKQLL